MSQFEMTLKMHKRDCLATYPPDPLPLLREGGVQVREGRSPSLKSLPPLLLRKGG